MVLQPLSTTVIYTIFFGYVARINTGKLPYAVFLLGGIVIWQYFSKALTDGSTSLANYSSLISKVHFPRLIVPIATVMSAGMDLLVMLGILLGAMLLYGVAPGWPVILAPIFILMTTLLTLGLSLCLTGIDAQFRDVRHVLAFVLQAWYFASPIVYPISLVPERFHTLYLLNPMTPIIMGFRWTFIGDSVAPPLWSVGVSFAISSVLILVGLVLFQRMERNIVDHL
jgi:lipopolysaccharide transport system permease protein